ncbi:MAG: hypothetical protein OXE50_02255 [Chloroflexi bacterium]|nr:hypothetical protein [Chloroflexota bacterium]
MTRTVPLSYLVRQQQLAAAEAIRAWFDDLTPPPPTIPLGTTHWTRDDELIAPPGEDQNWDWSVLFAYQGFDPDDSTRSLGPVKVVSDDLTTLADETVLLDNREGVAPLAVDLTRSVTFSRSRQESTESKLKVDIGSKVGGTIGGEAEGGTISAEISSTFGIEQDKGEIDRDSKDVTHSVHLATSVPVGDALLATISTPNLVTDQPFTVHGAIDGPFNISFNSGLFAGMFSQLMDGPRYSGPGPHFGGTGRRHSVHFTGFDDLFDALSGTNVDFPALHGGGPYGSDAIGTPAQIAAIDAARRIDWSGKIRRESEQSAGYAFSKVKSGDADKLLDQLPPDRVVKGT